MRSIQLKIGLCLAFTLWLPLSGSAAEATRPSGTRARRAARTEVDRTPHLGEESDGFGFHAADPAREPWSPHLDPATMASAVSLALPAPAGMWAGPECPGSPAGVPAATRRGRAPPFAS